MTGQPASVQTEMFLMAFTCCRMDEILRLLDGGFDVNTPLPQAGKFTSALVGAAELGYADMVSLFLERGAALNPVSADAVIRGM